MKDPEEEPLFTVKGLLLFAAVGVVYGWILLSLDPEYVAWAAPLVFGGSLYASDPPPASAHLAVPSDVLPLAFVYGCVALLAIALIELVQSRRHLDWFSWLNTAFERGRVAKLRSFLKSCLTFTLSR
jgi:hypothetical protein